MKVITNWTQLGPGEDRQLCLPGFLATLVDILYCITDAAKYILSYYYTLTPL